ncbi:MAG: CPXCG motif-containing cysteine-rich protein [Gammaproteobacteria bacterium]|nr:CPXCG motif-containing cysteine-rich protein [Gammaproteobacteria bacterium]
MSLLDAHLIGCPYCGEQIEILIDVSAGDQDYIEDCQVCCKPINLSIHIDHEGDLSVSARSDDE